MPASSGTHSTHGARIRSPSSAAESAPIKHSYATATAASASASGAASDSGRPRDSVPHPHLSKDSLNPPVSLPLTAALPAALPAHGRLRRCSERLLRWDTRASAYLHASSFFPFDLLLVPFAMICGIYGMPLLIPLVALVESPKLAATILISTLLTTALTTFGKRSVRRLRPCPSSLARKFFDLRRLEKNYSFPSGDSAQGAVVAANLYFYALSHAAAAAASSSSTVAAALASSSVSDAASLLLSPSYILLLMPLVMLARVYFGAHWWSDTVGGVACGWGATLASWAVVQAAFGWHVLGSDEAMQHGKGNMSIMRTIGFI